METETPLNAVELPYESLVGTRHEPLLRELWRLALPVLAEQVLHMLVGLNDTYLANHVERGGRAPAGCQFGAGLNGERGGGGGRGGGAGAAGGGGRGGRRGGGGVGVDGGGGGAARGAEGRGGRIRGLLWVGRRAVRGGRR